MRRWRRASELGRAVGVMMFEPHPREYLPAGRAALPPDAVEPQAGAIRKARAQAGIRRAFRRAPCRACRPTNSSSACWSRAWRAHVIIGYDFYFGHKRGGNPELMAQAGEELGFGVTIVAAGRGGGRSVLIVRRPAVSGAGRRARARRTMLGEQLAGAGKVVGGAKRGTGIGYPNRQRADAEGHGARPRHLRGTRVCRWRRRTTRPPTSARARPSTTACRCWRCSCSISTAISTATRSRSSSSTSSATTASSHSAEDLVAQMDSDVAKVRAVLAEA